MMNGRTPETEELFEDRKAQPTAPPPTIIHVAYMGVPIDIPVTAKRAQIEALVKDLLAHGWTAPPVAKGGFSKGSDLVEPAYDDHGNEVCPHHRSAIRSYTTKDGRTFKGCPSKATGAAGEKINERGYCALRFK